MGLVKGGFQRLLQTFLYFLVFLCAGVILGVYSYFLSVLADRNLHIPQWEKAVEGISGAAVLYTICAVILTCCLGGVSFFAFLALVLDVLFAAAFIAIAVLTRDGADNCKGQVQTPIGNGLAGQDNGFGTNGIGTDAGENVTYAVHLGLACRLNTAAFAVSIIGAFLFLCTAVMQIMLVRHHKKEKRLGKCPPWFMSGARKLILRILDPKPQTRITIPEILEDEWFKKGYTPPKFEEEEASTIEDVDAVFNDSAEHLVTEKKETQPVIMNAFELISMSQGLNLSNLFEKQEGLVKRETRFTSKHPAQEIVSKIEETVKPLGFNVEKKNYKMKLQGEKKGRKGHLSVATQVFQVAPSLFMVEVRKAGGDTLEFHKFYNNLSTGIKDIMWKSELEEN